MEVRASSFVRHRLIEGKSWIHPPSFAGFVGRFLTDLVCKTELGHFDGPFELIGPRGVDPADRNEFMPIARGGVVPF